MDPSTISAPTLRMKHLDLVSVLLAGPSPAPFLSKIAQAHRLRVVVRIVRPCLSSET